MSAVADCRICPRTSWPPCAQDIHRAVVFLRGRWDQNPTSLVGHLQSTLVASFSPLIYMQSAAPAPAAAAAASPVAVARRAVHHVVAVAGRDNVITVWLAAASRPVVILREVFQQPPSDLSWGADGYTLLVSGHDGTVVVLRLSEEELGVPLPEVRLWNRDWREGGVVEGGRDNCGGESAF